MMLPLALLLLLLASPQPAAARRTKASKQAFETPAAFTPAECGRIIAAASGRPQEIRDNPEVRRIYLGGEEET